jgi:hypothetical protein
MDRCTVSLRFFGAILCCTPSANSTLHRPDNSSNEINVTNSTLCVQWFTNPQTSAMAPTRNTVISSAVKVNTMKNRCNGHHTPSAHCSCSHLCHHRHAHSWRVVLRQTRRNRTQIVARQRQRFADVAWPSLHALYGQRAPLGLRRACFGCGSEF